MTQTYRLPKGYQINSIPEYYLDEIIDETLIWQPQIYTLALEMILRSGIKNLIDIGSGNGEKLKPFLDAGINVHIFDFGENLKFIAKKYSSYNNITLHECNLELSILELEDEIISNSVIIASDVIEHIVEPHYFLNWLSFYSQKSPLIIISTPDRDKIRGYGSQKSPENKAHVREWNLNEFLYLLKDYSIKNILSGYTTVNNHYADRSTLFALTGKCIPNESIENIPKQVSMAAILYLKNDDIFNFEWHLKFWREQNIKLYFIIEECQNKEILKSKLNEYFLTDCILDNFDEIKIKNISWIVESELSSYLSSNFSNILSLSDIINFIDQLGYTEICFKEQDYFNGYYALTDRFKSIKKFGVSYESTYPLFLKKSIFLNQPSSYMIHDSLQNKYLYLGDILSEDLYYFKQTFQNIKLMMSNLQDEKIQKELLISNLGKELFLIKNSTSWKITKPLRFMTQLIRRQNEYMDIDI